MGDVSELTEEDKHDKVYLSEFSAEERSMARRAKAEIAASAKLQGATRVEIARNLGKILKKYGRELSRDDLARAALKTDNIKPSERLGRYQVVPGKKLTPSKEKHLSKNARDYLTLAATAAAMVSVNEDKFVLDLVEGTKFDPRLTTNHTTDLRPAERLTEIIRGQVELLAIKYDITEYVELRRRYKARANRKRDDTYEFLVEHMDWSVDDDILEPVSITSLFSINTANGMCEWREPGKPWRRRSIEIEERVSFGLFPGEGRSVFGAFVISPRFYLPPVKNPKQIEVRPSNLPQDIKRPWVIYPNSAGWRVRLNDEGNVLAPDLEDYKENTHPARTLNIVRLPDDHGMDLKRFRDVWIKRLKATGMRKSTDPKFRTNLAMAKPIYDPVSISAVAHWLDRPLPVVRRRPGDAFAFEVGRFDDPFRPTGPTAPKFDGSRGLSPPDSMMAEVEVGLCYDGYQGLFDQNNGSMVIEHLDYEVGEGAEPIQKMETTDLTFADTFLDLIERDIKAQTSAFKEWRGSIQGEILKRSDDLLKHIDDQLAMESARIKKGVEEI
jgi:hypothetical protein